MKKHEPDIIDRIHIRRTELLAQFGNDVAQYAAHLRKREKTHPHRVVEQIKIVSVESD